MPLFAKGKLHDSVLDPQAMRPSVMTINLWGGRRGGDHDDNNLSEDKVGVMKGWGSAVYYQRMHLGSFPRKGT